MVQARRTKGEGTISRVHDHPSCPKAEPGSRTRPDHECRGSWRFILDLGVVQGRRLRPSVQARTLKELRPKMEELKAQHRAGSATERRDRTVEAWMGHWLEKVAPRRNRESTVRTYRSYANNWIVPEIGYVKLSRLRAEHIEALYDAMKDAGRTDATVRQVHAILSKSLKDAVRRNWLARSPMDIAEPPATPKGTAHEALAIEDAKKVLRGAVSARDAARLALAILLGLRQGEALGLMWSDIAGGRMQIDRAVQRQTGKGLVVTELKTEASQRNIPVIPGVAAVLEQWREESGGAGYVFPGAGEKPTEPRKDYEAWRQACIRVGVTPVPLHGARATTASILRELGFSEQVIADILGHANVKTTMKHYIRSSEDQRQAAMDALADLLGDTPALESGDAV